MANAKAIQSDSKRAQTGPPRLISRPHRKAGGGALAGPILYALGLGLTVGVAHGQSPTSITLNQPADGYRGIWYMNQPSGDEYVYKYSGGLGTYCAKHKPFAIYSPRANKTFFCYGGAPADDNRRLLHMVSYFDHATGTVPRPTIVLDKQTDDAHDNPVLSIDDDGHLWIFSTSHGTSRPSYIHRSTRPLDIAEFELVPATRETDQGPQRIDNFSYMQVWHQPGEGFLAFFTRYGYPAARTLCFMRSDDGVSWSHWQRLAAIDAGHYQISGFGKAKTGSMLNYHPRGKGLNWRTNLYYIESDSRGETWTNAQGEPLSLPLTEVDNAALVRDYEAEGLNVYLKDLRFDQYDRPVLLYITSGGYESGPRNDPRTWTVARWNGRAWLFSPVTTSDNNYDMGELHLLAEDDWRVIGPTGTGPQPYNPGGEVVMWISRDQGASWHQQRQLTTDSPMNHTYVRRVLQAHPDFVALWADGHGRQPSESRLYFSDLAGTVYRLPRQMHADRARPMVVGRRVAQTAPSLGDTVTWFSTGDSGRLAQPGGWPPAADRPMTCCQLRSSNPGSRCLLPPRRSRNTGCRCNQGRPRGCQPR